MRGGGVGVNSWAMRPTVALAFLLLVACTEAGETVEPPPTYTPPEPPNVAGQYELREANGDMVADNGGDTCEREYLSGNMTLAADSSAAGRIVSGRTCNGVRSRTAARYDGTYTVRADSVLFYRGLGDDDTKGWRYMKTNHLQILVRADHTLPWDTLMFRRQ